MNLRNILLIIAVLLWLPVTRLSAQVEMHCVAMSLTTDGEWNPLPDVEIQVEGAPAVVSDAEGNFTLFFETAKVGDPLVFKNITKNGYELINGSGLSQRVVTRRDQLTVVMGMKEQFMRTCDAYMQLTSATFAIDYFERQRLLAEERAVSLRFEDEYRKRLDDVEEEYRVGLQSLDIFLEQFPNRAMIPANPANSVGRLLDSFVLEANDFQQLKNAREQLMKKQ